MELFAREFYSCDMMNWSLVIIVKENSKPAESRMGFDIWDRGINGVSKLNSVTKIKKYKICSNTILNHTICKHKYIKNKYFKIISTLFFEQEVN